MATGTIQSNRVLLWTNQSPSTLAPQTVNLSLSAYSCVEIECTRIGDTGEAYFVLSPIGSNSVPNTIDLTNTRLEVDNGNLNAITILTRKADIYSSGIVFHEGNMLYNGTSYAGWNNRAVPYRIWGLR